MEKYSKAAKLPLLDGTVTVTEPEALPLAWDGLENSGVRNSFRSWRIGIGGSGARKLAAKQSRGPARGRIPFLSGVGLLLARRTARARAGS